MIIECTGITPEQLRWRRAARLLRMRQQYPLAADIDAADTAETRAPKPARVPKRRHPVVRIDVKTGERRIFPTASHAAQNHANIGRRSSDLRVHILAAIANGTEFFGYRWEKA